jgi:CheY-like chemotaxis protein
MYSVLCPHCHFVNPADATYCRNCSTAFGLDPDQGALDPASTAWQPSGRHGLQPGATLKPADPPSPRRRASDLEPTPESPLDAARSDPPPAVAAQTPAVLTLIEPLQAPAGGFAEQPSLDGGLSTQGAWPDLALPGSAPAAVDPAVGHGGPPTTVPDRRTVTKAMARQAARRARMAALIADTVLPPPVDVLVLDGDDGTRAELVGLLGRFGFHVHEALDLYQAEQLADAAPYAAAFLDIRLDDSDGGAGVALCERLHRPVRSGPSTAVVLMSPRLRPADRVRAALARSDAVLAKPLSRGDVARTLESCGVALPADERRH